jgi:PHD/YefM family antitoxin component YafN of YafNO toxin-antitoxin module
MNTVNPFETLTQLPATDVKNHGWKGVMRCVAAQGKVVVTNHREPEAVILTTQEYARIMAIVAQAEGETNVALETLRRRFDDRLASLQAADAGDRLRSVMGAPARLDGQLKAGSDF